MVQWSRPRRLRCGLPLVQRTRLVRKDLKSFLRAERNYRLGVRFNSIRYSLLSSTVRYATSASSVSFHRAILRRLHVHISSNPFALPRRSRMELAYAAWNAIGHIRNRICTGSLYPGVALLMNVSSLFRAILRSCNYCFSTPS